MSRRALRVLVVDDEELARLRLRQLIGESGEGRADVVGEVGTVAQALAWLATHDCDLVMLDIQMPGADGTQLAAALRVRAAEGERAPAVVFVTAHAQHALRAFELEALDYLTKPVRRDRLDAALTRAQRRMVDDLPAERPVADAASPPLAGPELVVTERGRVVRVPISDVLYLKAELKYVTLRTARQSYLLDDALSDLEQRLGPSMLRIHRNALVSPRAVRLLERRPLQPGEDDAQEGWAVWVEPVGEWLAVSRRQLPAVRSAIAAGGL